ncbi:MAG TPA: hypothetical protein VKR32_17075 [Puia sp.]|nr:hypothetical protein [Puia sp.]
MKKYSYHVFGFYIRQPMQLDSAGNVLGGETGGTCFFIRKNGELFLITAKHVLTGCDSLEKVKNFPSSLMIWVSPNSSFRIAQFDVSIIRDTASCLPIPLSPDEIVIRIKDSSAKDVYSIEKFLSAPFKKVRNSLFIGYPAATSTLAGRIKRVEPSTIGLVNKEYYFSQGYTDSTRKNLDIINHRIYSDSIDFEQNFHGYSGSPLFVQDLKTKKWRIAGVLAGTGRDNFNKYYFYAVRIEYPLSDIGITY